MQIKNKIVEARSQAYIYGLFVGYCINSGQINYMGAEKYMIWAVPRLGALHWSIYAAIVIGLLSFHIYKLYKDNKV